MENQPLSFEAASLTDIGLVRGNNEDSISVITNKEPGKYRFDSFGVYIVADGMGGHRGGEIASEIATRMVSITLVDNLSRINESQNPDSLIKKAIEKANKEILKMAGTRQELCSMGTTITVGLRLENDLYIGHVGDSRAYLVRGYEITQLTEDHSLIAKLLNEGMITAEEAKTHPDRGIIFRCLGVSDKVKVDSYFQANKEKKLTLKDNDCIIFCTDGLTIHVTDGEIFSVAAESETAGEACERLIGLANSRGGEDNISVIVLKVTDAKTA